MSVDDEAIDVTHSTTPLSPLAAIPQTTPPRAARKYAAQYEQQRHDQLVLEHLDYVRHILGKLVAQLPRGVDVENLESAGILGLVEAARQYDPSRDIAFKTYAYPRIRGAILDELRRNSPLPQKMLQRLALVRRALEQLTPPASVAQIAEQTGLSADDVEEALDALRLTKMQSYDAAVGVGGVRDHREEQPGHSLEEAELRRVLADGIERLPERERLVLTLYYLEDLRLKEIGKVLELSEARISRILSHAEFLVGQYVKAHGG